jgi:hypothetical protein
VTVLKATLSKLNAALSNDESLFQGSFIYHWSTGLLKIRLNMQIRLNMPIGLHDSSILSLFRPH